MSRIAVLGTGRMGAPMVGCLVRAEHRVTAFDTSAPARAQARKAGADIAESQAEAVAEAEVVITMLPQSAHVRQVYLGREDRKGILSQAAPDTLLIDSSTIDPATSREVTAAAARAGLDMLDAPVSGGVAGAQAGTLTFMAGGSARAFERARPILEAMGGKVFHAGDPGSGQVAKICNNLILGVSMISVCEAFALAQGQGLEAAKLFDIASVSSGQCWALTSYCPVPGLVPSSPANRGYAPGFTAAMMLKDLRLAHDAATASGISIPLGETAAALYDRFVDSGQANTDFSAIKPSERV